MSVWKTFDAAYAEGNLPTDVVARHAVWVNDHPTRSGRLAALCSEVAAAFREGLRIEAAEDLDADSAKLCERCLRHALAFVAFELTVEMADGASGGTNPLGVFSSDPPAAGTALNVGLGGSYVSDDRMWYIDAKVFLAGLMAGRSKGSAVGTPQYRNRPAVVDIYERGRT